ncbi:hypothetical protein Mapa_016966 [Marchantia paleacea]|nr:hypothetical protein Mapa_016966 [Marchantia paleacea]
MYDTIRNATVKATSETLLWAVDRPTFKSIISRHLSGSQTAQVLREAPALKKMATREIVRISSQCTIQHSIRGQNILAAGSQLDKIYIIQEGQVRVSRAAGGKTAGGGDTVALMNRLEVELIVMPRSLFDSNILKTIRKGLQIQLITLALQRVPAFIEIDQEQISNLADSFTESNYAKGQEIIKRGDSLDSNSRLYVVQQGSVTSYKMPDRQRAGSVSDDSKTGWGQRLGSFLKGSSGSSPLGQLSSSPSPRSSEGNSIATPNGGASRVSSAGSSPKSSVSKGSKVTDSPIGERRFTGLIETWSISVFGVFGEECLRCGVKEDSAGCQTTTVVYSSGGAICLSVSLEQIIKVLGPIHELLLRVANLKVLRKVPCLEFLSNAEMDIVLHSLGVRKLKPGDVVYRAGDAADRLYIIQKGCVTKTIKNPKDGKVEEEILTKGSFFGENALDKTSPRSTTAIAGQGDPVSKTVELYYLDRAVLETNLGPLSELNEIRKKDFEKKGIMKQITFDELEEIGLLGTGLFGKVKLVYSKRTEEYYALKCVRKAQVQQSQP